MNANQTPEPGDDRRVSASKPSPKMPKIIRFEELVVCGDEIWIDNNNDLYRLRRTKQGKLILTK